MSIKQNFQESLLQGPGSCMVEGSMCIEKGHFLLFKFIDI